MGEYIICRKALGPAKVKGKLPDVISEYVAQESFVGWHYEFTRNRKDAYRFIDSSEAESIAYLLSMEVEEVRI